MQGKWKVRGLNLNVVESGAGLPVLLVHGFPLDHTMWQPQLEALAGEAHVVAPDLRGFGASDAGGETVSMEDYADDLAALLDARTIQEPVVFCGLSMGGYIAWQFWQRHRARLRGLILCDTRAAADTPEAAANRLATADRVLREGPSPVLQAMLPKLVAESMAKAGPEVVE
nr:alpha/beta hydrolase [Candidatus Anammoximicrobium sp.]